MSTYKEGSAEEEAQETPEEEGAETEQSSNEESGDVKIPEAFQRSVDDLLEGTNEHQLEFIRSAVMTRERELRKAQSKSERAGTFDTEGMPE